MAKRKTKNETTLFDAAEKLYFLTNRANVIQILSSGLIRPRAAYEKYYDDLLELSPGNILLFHKGVPASLLPLVSIPDSGLFPVILEIDASRVTLPSNRVCLPEIVREEVDGSNAEGDTLCDAVQEPIPISSVVRLCFLQAEDLMEFRAHEFDNVPAVIDTAVESSVLLSDGPDPNEFRQSIGALPAGEGSEESFRNLDSAMGAMTLLTILLPNRIEWIKAAASAVSFPNRKTDKSLSSVSWLISLFENILSHDTPDVREHNVDNRLILAAIHVLKTARPREGWNEAHIADEIVKYASVEADMDQLKEIRKWRDFVVETANGDRQAGSLDDSRSLVRRGLLLLLLRNEPERIMRAGETQLMPGPMVTAIAGILSGLFHGYSRLSRDLKQAAVGMKALAELALTWWSAVDGRKRKINIRVLSKDEDQAITSVSVTANGVTLLKRKIGPNDLLMRIFYQAKAVGFTSTYDADLDALICHLSTESGSSRRIILETIHPAVNDHIAVRIRTACLQSNGKTIKISKKDDAIDLLERNYHPDIQCRFGLVPEKKEVEVLVHQLLETMDSAELKSHIETVADTAKKYEAYWINANPKTTNKTPKRSAKTKKDTPK